jgi:hypothetical protein
MLKCNQHPDPWILWQQWTSLRCLSVHSLHRQQQQNILWTSVFHIKGGTTEAIENTKIGTVCSYIIVQAVPEGHTCPHHDHKWVLPTDRFFHCIDMDPGSTKQMEDICGQQSRHHPTRNIISHMETRADSMQSCLSHFKRNGSSKTSNIHIMVVLHTPRHTDLFH